MNFGRFLYFIFYLKPKLLIVLIENYVLYIELLRNSLL